MYYFSLPVYFKAHLFSPEFAYHMIIWNALMVLSDYCIYLLETLRKEAFP